MTGEQSSNGAHGTDGAGRDGVPTRGKVYLDASALKSIVLYAKRYANENLPEHEWKEVYGFLIGRIEGSDVHVDSATPMTSGEATEVVFDASHYSKAWELDTEIADRQDNSFVCGWWHTHPFKDNPQSIFLSSIDVTNHLGFQGPNPLAIALVHDPTKVKSRDVQFGIKIFRLTHAGFTSDDLHRFALDLTPDGRTRSDDNEVVYHEVPFEIVGVTPELFTDSLVDVFETTAKGLPAVKAYREGVGVAGSDTTATPARGDRAPVQGDNESETRAMVANDQHDGEPPSLPPALPGEMEALARTHVLPRDDFHASDPGTATAEADAFYENALALKVKGQHGDAIVQLERARRVYSKLDAPMRLAFIVNELVECYYWTSRHDDALIASRKLLALGEEVGTFYFMGNAREHEGRVMLRKGKVQEASAALQDARVHFSSGGYHARSGACTELIARILYNDQPPDLDRAALFLAKALASYHRALKEPTEHEPGWVSSGFLHGHATLLERLARDTTRRLPDADVARKVLDDLDALGTGT